MDPTFEVSKTSKVYTTVVKTKPSLFEKNSKG